MFLYLLHLASTSLDKLEEFIPASHPDRLSAFLPSERILPGALLYVLPIQWDH